MAGTAAAPTVTDDRTATAVIDIHQHLWPEELLSALSRRRNLPRLRRAGADWVVQLAGEPDAVVDLADHDPDRRARLARIDGVDRVVVAPSSPIGIEALPPADAEPLIRAYHEGVRALPHPFSGWATLSLHDPDADALEERLDEGFVGLCLPAAALGDPRGLDRLSVLFDRLERHDAPLFVHPGPAPWATPPAPVDPRLPGWWWPLTTYVTQMHAAWHLWLAVGRRLHPELRVCFALLAGLAPLHRERRVLRGGSDDAVDGRLFYDTSSYGPGAIGQMVDTVGSDALVNGSDRPVDDLVAGHTGLDAHAITRGNPARLFGWTEAQ
jgi:predicted TIM-barrel fold metal-dependent hydrolase